jgi:hypothetical protein
MCFCCVFLQGDVSEAAIIDVDRDISGFVAEGDVLPTRSSEHVRYMFLRFPNFKLRDISDAAVLEV